VKRPLKPGLLASDQEIDQYLTEYAKYKKYIIQHIQSESGLSDLSDLIVYLSETYHTDPKIRLKQKIGAKTKWSDWLNCSIAVEINHLRKQNITRIKALKALTNDPLWNKLIPKNSKDPQGLFDKADKAGKKLKLYPVMIKARLYSQEKNELDEYYESIESAIEEAVKKN
jgi:hypothetical protein